MQPDAPLFIVMAGLPGSGKSALTKKIIGENADDWFVFSSDARIEEMGKERGLTYSQMFKAEPKIVKIAEAQMMDLLKGAVARRKNIIWDRTCVTKKSRWVARNVLPGHNAVCAFLMPPETQADYTLWGNTLDNRPGKHIPSHVLTSMSVNMEIPEDNEEFSKVVKIPFGAPFEDYIYEIVN